MLRHWKQTELLLESDVGHLKHIFPNLRVLYISIGKVLPNHLLALLSKLDFLSLQFDRGCRGAFREEPMLPSSRIVLPIKTLHLLISDAANIHPLEHWDMPLLAHLECRESALDMPSIPNIVWSIGRNLISLRLWFEHDYVDLPDDMWRHLLALQYLGVTTFRLPLSSLIGHPLHTAVILGDGGHTSRARRQA